MLDSVCWLALVKHLGLKELCLYALYRFKKTVSLIPDLVKSGYNEYGQLGRGVTSEGLQGARLINGFARFLDEAPEIVKIGQVSCGEYHSAAISDNGEV